MNDDLDLFLQDFGKLVSAGAVTGLGILDMPGQVIADGMVINTDYRLTVRTTRSAGRLDLNRLAEQVPDWRDRQTWACGPEGMLAEAEKVWAAEGLADQLHLERFAAVRSPVSGGGGTVTFARSARTRRADAAQMRRND